MSTTPIRYCVIEMRSERLADLITTLPLGEFDLVALPDTALPSGQRRAEFAIVDNRVQSFGEAGEG